MEATFIRVGGRLVNLSLVCDVKWHDGRLYLNLSNGSYVRLEGEVAERFLALLESRIVDLAASVIGGPD